MASTNGGLLRLSAPGINYEGYKMDLDCFKLISHHYRPKYLTGKNDNNGGTFVLTCCKILLLIANLYGGVNRLGCEREVEKA